MARPRPVGRISVGRMQVHVSAVTPVIVDLVCCLLPSCTGNLAALMKPVVPSMVSSITPTNVAIMAILTIVSAVARAIMITVAVMPSSILLA